MLIGGIQTLTLLDYPETVAAIIFTAGCNMRCSYCHNPELVLPERIKCQKDFIPESKVLNFLETRKGLLEGLVISGGEPTVHPDLISFMKKVKALEFKIKLDTNGTDPKTVATAIEQKLVDYIAVDIKSAPEKYDDLTQVQNDFKAITQTRDLLLQSEIPYEFRTTFINGYHTQRDFQGIGNFIKGAEKYTIQNFRKNQTLNPSFKQYSGFASSELEEIKSMMKPFAKRVQVI